MCTRCRYKTTHSMNTWWGKKKGKKKQNICFVLNLGSGRPSDTI